MAVECFTIEIVTRDDNNPPPITTEDICELVTDAFDERNVIAVAVKGPWDNVGMKMGYPGLMKEQG